MAGLLVLLVTVLVVNQLLNRRQARQHGHVVAAQAAILVAPAARSADAVSSVIKGSDDRAAASDGFRTYTMMLLIAAPVLIDAPVARHFLEQAQYLGGVMARALAITAGHPTVLPCIATCWTTPCASSRLPRHHCFSCSVPGCAIPSSASARLPKSRREQERPLA